MHTLRQSMRHLSIGRKKEHEDFPGQHELALPARARHSKNGTEGPTQHMTPQERMEFLKGQAAAKAALAAYQARRQPKGQATFDHHTPSEVFA